MSVPSTPLLRRLLSLLLPVALTGILFETISRLILPQPIQTPSRAMLPNGLIVNLSKGSAIDSIGGRDPVKYYYGFMHSRVAKPSAIKAAPSVSPSNSCQILILGDSFAFGSLVEHENTFIHLVEARLNANQFKSKPVSFVNSAAGGWGFADYISFLSYFTKAVRHYNGIVIFFNADDSRRAVTSGLYKYSPYSNALREESSGTLNTTFLRAHAWLPASQLKRIIDGGHVLPLYSLLLEYINSFRIAKSLFLYGSVYRIHALTTSDGPHVLGSSRLDPGEQEYAIPKLRAILTHLSRLSVNLPPLALIYIGTTPLEKLSDVNRYIFTSDGRRLMSSLGLAYNFDLLDKAPLLDDSHLIAGDLHPNALGHRKISAELQASQGPHSLVRFLRRVCR